MSDPVRILSVDDDADIRRIVRAAFALSGLDVFPAGSAAEAFAWIRVHGLPDLGVFDVSMPAESGLELCRRIHAFCDLPVIFLTVVDDEETVVAAIDQHAEDWLTKPFRPRELVARARRVLKRVGGRSGTPTPLVAIDRRLSIAYSRQLAVVEGRELSLTPTETKILHILVRASPRIVATEHLLRRVWPDEETYEDTLRVHVHRLRQKIEIDPSRPAYVVTHRGLGYSFVPGDVRDRGESS
jgi:DNA-binding response OmpR family regulator